MNDLFCLGIGATRSVPYGLEIGWIPCRFLSQNIFCGFFPPLVLQLAQRLAGAPLKVQAGIKDLVERGIAVEWDIDVRVTNAFLGVSTAPLPAVS